MDENKPNDENHLDVTKPEETPNEQNTQPNASCSLILFATAVGILVSWLIIHGMNVIAVSYGYSPMEEPASIIFGVFFFLCFYVLTVGIYGAIIKYGFEMTCLTVVMILGGVILLAIPLVLLVLFLMSDYLYTGLAIIACVIVFVTVVREIAQAGKKQNPPT